MYTTQTETTFSKTDLDKENFAKGKNEGKLCIAFPRVTGNSSEAVTWDNMSLLLSIQIWVQCQRKEFHGFVPIGVMFMVFFCFVMFCFVLWSLFVKGDHLRHMPNDWDGICMKYFHFNNSFWFLDERQLNPGACVKMNHKSQKYCPNAMHWLQREFTCTYGHILA